MIVTDIKEINIDQAMTTTDTIMTEKITTNRDIHNTIDELPITIAALVPQEIIDHPRIIDAMTLPVPSLNEVPKRRVLGKHVL